MPPSWTDTTDPNADFDTQGRVYQTMLPFNSFFDATKLHPDGEIDVSYSDDLGRHWVKGNGGVPLEPPNNASAKQVGHVEDKQWVAVNHIVGNRFQDHVYAAWAVFNGNGGDQGAHGGLARPRPDLRQGGHDHPAVAGRPRRDLRLPGDRRGRATSTSRSSRSRRTASASTIYVARSTDDGRTFGAFVPITTVTMPSRRGVLPNTRFRDGITESFAASPTYPGHLYLTYEDWDAAAGQMDVKFTQSTDGGATWTTPVVVNDNVDPPGAPTDQFQPSVAAGPNGAVAVAFYDRRAGLPERPERPARRRRADELLHRHLAAGVQGQRQRRGAGRGERADLAVHLGSGAAGPAPRRPARSILRRSAQTRARTAAGSSATTSGSRSPSGNIYALMVSTHYPSNVTADEGGPIYYQQQVLATVPRAAFGAGY